MFDFLNSMPSSQVFFGQVLVGIINGSFYAMLSLGLAVIFGMLNIVNFAHGAQYMLGALFAWILLKYFGIGYWPALMLAPLIVGALGLVFERLLLRRLYKLDHMYGMLMTYGAALVLEGTVRNYFGSTGSSYPVPPLLAGGWDLGFMFMPVYRGWVVVFSLVACVGTWYMIERTTLGANLRAATENPMLTRTFGINVPRMVMLTYGFGVAMAALAGVLAAPIYQVNASMGADLIIVVFAVVVIGSMGSIVGAIVSGFSLGIAEGLTKAFYPQASTTVVFVIMVVVLIVRPSGLFGSTVQTITAATHSSSAAPLGLSHKAKVVALLFGAVGVVAPFLVYPVFLMKVLSLGLFAGALNLLLGYGGLMSFGHAAFFGSASYMTAVAVKIWGFDPLLGMLSGACVSAILGVAFGYLAIRRRGIYFAMITLALAQIIYFFAVEAPFTRNDEGIQGVPRGHLFGMIDLSNSLTMYYFVFVIFIVGYGIIYRTVNSPFGGILRAIRENEQRVISLGYEVSRFKLLAFTLSATLSGIAGGMDALIYQMASLTNVHWSMSGNAVLMVLIGGVGTLTGPIVGALIVAGMEQYTAQLGSWVTVVQGLIFIICVLAFRRGLVGEIGRYYHRTMTAIGDRARAISQDRQLQQR